MGSLNNVKKNLSLGRKPTAGAQEPARKSSRKRVPKKYLQKTVAMYDFKTEKDGELSFHVGQIIYVTKRHGQGWSEGYADGRTGAFPSNFVTHCE